MEISSLCSFAISANNDEIDMYTIDQGNEMHRFEIADITRYLPWLPAQEHVRKFSRHLY